MRMTVWGVALVMCAGTPLAGQTGTAGLIEIPLRVEDGRLLVTARDGAGAEHDFVLGLAQTVLTESGARQLGEGLSSLELNGVPVDMEGAQTAPDSFLPDSKAVGVLGGRTLNGYDVLIDVPQGRLVLKPLGRAVRWDGARLSSPVPLQVFHDVLLRADVEVGGKVVGGLLDLAKPGLELSEPLRFALGDGRVASFRMGYGGWTDLPAAVVDSPTFSRWDPQGEGFVVIGAFIAYDCVIAISWFHSELRTCMQ